MTDDDTRAVRESEALDWRSLTAYLRAELPRQAAVEDIWARQGQPRAALAPALANDLRVEQFGGGHSNLTYLLRFGDLGLVLRRPPLGPVPPRAHDMAREFRWLSALHPHFALAPRPLLLCEDQAVIGATFYVMERREGLVIRHEEPAALFAPAGGAALAGAATEAPDLRVARRAAVSGALIDTLADLHQVDATAPDLAGLGRPAGFVSRQVQGWRDRWVAARTEDLPDMEAVADWLGRHLPPEPERPAVVHGDFKLDNVMLDAHDPARVVAVLDWEMCALGDPLVDVGILLGYWIPTERQDSAAPRDALSTVTDRPGYFSREALLDRYAARTGANLDDIGFYETFAVFKLAVVLQQIYVRYVRGQTDDARFASLGERVRRLSIRAAALVSRHS